MTETTHSGLAVPPVPVVLVRLKVRLLRNRWRAARGRVAAGLSAILALIAGIVGLIASINAGAAADGRDRSAFVVVGAIVVVIVWAVAPLLTLNVDDTLDPARLQLLPLRARPLMLGLLGASLVGFGPLALMITLIGVVIGYASGVATVITIIAALGLLVLGAATARTVATLLAATITSRRGRDVTIAVTAVLGVGLQLLRFVDISGVDPDLVAHVTNVVRWTPPGALGHAILDAGNGRIVIAVAELLAAMSVVPVLLAIWASALQRSLTTVTGSSRRSRVVSLRDGRLRLIPTTMPWLSGTPVGAVIAKELRITVRDPRRRIGLLQLVAIGLGGPIWIAISSSSGSPSIVFAASIAGYLAILGAMNQFALDGGALWIDIVVGDRIRVVAIGKNLALATQVLPVMLLGTISVATITGQWRYVPAAMLVGVGGLGAGLGVADIVSVRFPQKLPDSRNPFAGAGGGAGLTQTFAVLAAILIQGAVISPVAIATAVAIAVAPASLVIVAPACAVYGCVLWRVGINAAHLWAAPRQPELLAAVDSGRSTPSTPQLRTMRWAPTTAGGVARAAGDHTAGRPAPSAVADVPITGTRALRAGLLAASRRCRPAAMVAIAMVLPVIALFVFMAGANSIAFGYNSFTGDANPGAANVVAGISLALFWVLENGVVAWMFGAFCVLGLEPDATARHAIRRSWHTRVRRSWRAIPAMVITAAAVVLVFAGPLIVAAFLPFAIRDVESPTPNHRRVPGIYARDVVIGLPITAFAIASWIIGAQLSGVDVPDPVVAILLVALAGAAAAVTALTAFAAAELHLALQ